MMTNILADAGLGFVPVAGDIAAAIYKSNTRNAAILEGILRKRGQENLKKAGPAGAAAATTASGGILHAPKTWFGLGSKKDTTVTSPTSVLETVSAPPSTVPVNNLLSSSTHHSPSTAPPALPPNHPPQTPPTLPPNHPL